MNTKLIGLVSVTLAIVLLLLTSWGAAFARGEEQRRDHARPLAFEANRGQADEQVKFLARGAGYTVFLTPTEAVVALDRVGGGCWRWLLRLRWLALERAVRPVDVVVIDEDAHDAFEVAAGRMVAARALWALGNLRLRSAPQQVITSLRHEAEMVVRGVSESARQAARSGELGARRRGLLVVEG